MKKGFTLIELVAVIILLGLLGLIILPTVNGVIKNNKQKLHDKQIEELVKYGNTYSAYNMTQLNRKYGSKNIVTFEDLRNAGIIQNETIIDPATEEEMDGCLSLIWNSSRKEFDIEYVEECTKYASISGTITESNSPIEATVQLLQGSEVVYTTTTDSNGNYNFTNVETGTYILLASQPYKTKYGQEVEINDNVTKDMNVTFYIGDFDNDGYISVRDLYEMDCWHSRKSICKDWTFYDINNDGVANMNDETTLQNNKKISDINLSGTFNLSGKVTTDKNMPKTITLSNNSNRYTYKIDSDGSYKFENIPKGAYRLYIYLSGHADYDRYFLITDDDITIDAHMFYYDVDGDGYLGEDDIKKITDAIYAINYWRDTYEDYPSCDINKDGAIDNKDITLLQKTIQRYNSYYNW